MRLKGALFVFLLIFCRSSFAQVDWHEQVPILINRDQISIVVPLTRSWKVQSVANGSLTASNDQFGTMLTVQILQVAGNLRSIVANFFPPDSCSFFHSRIFTVGGIETEETSCQVSTPFPAVEVGRFFFKNGDLIFIESKTNPDKFPIFADSIWSILRGIYPRSSLASAQIPSGDKLYQSPDKEFELSYPQNWEEQLTGKTLLLYVPKGPSVQIIPAEDQLLTNDPKEVFLSFQQSLVYSLKGFNLESRDTLLVNGIDEPRITYTYLLPDGQEERAWALFFNFPKSAYLVVCASPAAAFDASSTTFVSIMKSFQVSP